MKQEEKKLSEGPEEAAMAQYPKVWKEYPKDGIIRSEEYYDLNEDRRGAFIVGAEWQKNKMLEGAVEGKVFMSFVPGHNQVVTADVDLPTNTKVKVIIVKED